MQEMAKRTIKPAAGESRVSLEEATVAARVVRRDGSTGHFVILERDVSRSHDRYQKWLAVRDDVKVGGKRSKESSSSGSFRSITKKR
jgi:hypothetical protein